MQQAATDIVHTVVDELGAWAMLTDEAQADLYAARVHGVRGPDMTRGAAEKLVHGILESPKTTEAKSP